ncbi:hypothetical protein V5N11_024266 [Cardamine amara subsp. amara]|uniref:Uncharacterized protein n=1 Tax=Cardamine amara subsp. amara TaxID=228776 RepID=A0ABD1BIH9_CARAN
MAIRSRVITMSPLILNQEDDLEVDLDLWEVVNPSDGEYSDDSFSVDSLSDDDVISLDDASFVSPPSVISPPPQMLSVADSGDLPADLVLDSHVDGDNVRDEVDEIDLGWAQRRMVFVGGGSYGDDVNRDGCYDDGGEDCTGEDGEYDDSYDLDEELVPRSVSKKLGRQRMRKLGKRAIAKISKKTPYLHLKASVGGKLGLGLKFKY